MGTHDSCLCWRHFLGATPHDLTAKEFTERRFPPYRCYGIIMWMWWCLGPKTCVYKSKQCKWKNGGLCTCAEGLRPILAEAASLKIIFIYAVAFNSWFSHCPLNETHCCVWIASPMVQHKHTEPNHSANSIQKWNPDEGIGSWKSFHCLYAARALS